MNGYKLVLNLFLILGAVLTSEGRCQEDCNGNGQDDISDINDGAFVGFETPVTYPVTCVSPFSAAAGDFDGDGDLDLAVGALLCDTLDILANNGTLANGNVDLVKVESLSTLAGEFPAYVKPGDFNGDDLLDLATVNRDSDDAAVFLNNGGSEGIAFAGPNIYDVGDFPLFADTGDLNGDGSLDLAVSNRNSGTVSVLLNRDDDTGMFQEAVEYSSGGIRPFSVVVGDYDGDGDLDLALSNLNSHTVSVLQNDGAGTFNTTPVTFAVEQSPLAMTSADFNGDGLNDLAVPHQSAATCSVLLNTGGEGVVDFASPVSYRVGAVPYSATAMDWDGDGDIDVAVANAVSNSLSLLRNVGDGTFGGAAESLPPGVRSPTFLTSGDFDGDGNLDLAVGNDDTNSRVSVILSRWEKSEDLDANQIPDECERPFVRADANGDGRVNLADPSFIANAIFIEGSEQPQCEAAADANGDGRLNIADPSFVANAIFIAGAPQPPPPFPACGIDPDPQGLICETPPEACLSP